MEEDNVEDGWDWTLKGKKIVAKVRSVCNILIYIY